MKNIFTIIILLVTLLFIVISCQVPTEPIEDRISKFESDLNKEDRSSIYQNFHPDAKDYDSIKDTDFWDDSPLTYAYASFSISITSGPTDAGNGVWDVGTEVENDNGTFDCDFDMKQDGSDWFILKLSFEATDDTFVIKKIQ